MTRSVVSGRAAFGAGTTTDPAGTLGPLRLLIAVGGTVTTCEVGTSGVLSLGREAGCKVVIADPSVSRKHARLYVGTPSRIEDLGSKHGTSLLGRLLDPFRPASLAVGSTVNLGATVVMLHGGPALVSPSATKVQPPSGVVCDDPLTRSLFALVTTIAPSTLPILVLGETGTGKEVIAQTVHARGARAKGVFRVVNCATFSKADIESELFGHGRGANDSAPAARAGVFEAAHGGTLLLDEIGDLPLVTQDKLLHVLERGEVTRAGSTEPRKVDVRVIAATSRDLTTMVEQGLFLPDLLLRISGFTLTLPPLRARRFDVLPLARRFATAIRPDIVFTADAENALLMHNWHGNVRELRHVVERAVVLSGGTSAVQTSHLIVVPPPATHHDDFYARLKAEKEDGERGQIIAALERADGSQTRAAEALGISRRSLVSKLAELGIPARRR